MRRLSVVLLVTWCCVAPSCSGSSASPSPAPAPTPAPANYEGQWTGLTSQGLDFSFTVSPTQTVTTVSFSYSLAGCNGGVGGFMSPGAPILTTTPTPSFTFTQGGPDTTNFMEIAGSFSSATTASGTITLRRATCGNTNTLVAWTASKRL
jgi:hypothetical protein